MRRGTILLILALACVITGAACVSAGVVDALRLGRVAVVPVVGATLLTIGSAAGLLLTLSGRRERQALIERLQATNGSRELRHIEAPAADAVPLVSAINDLIDDAHRIAADALLKTKEMEIQLKVATAERHHAEAIIYSISDAVLVTDPFDELVLANEAAARTFEFDLVRAGRSPVAGVVGDAKVVELIRDMRQSHSRGGRRVVEHKMRTRDGDRTFKVTLSCVADRSAAEVDRCELNAPAATGAAGVPRGRAAGVVVVLHDMTREKEVSEMKNDFVSNVSHELRTPLASIKAYVEMLIDGEAEDEKTKREFYDVIQNEANRLSRLIDNILNISRIESGLVKVIKAPQSLAVIMKEAVEVIGPQAKGKRITVREELAPVFYQTLADKDMLYQAVLNLLSNAVKYTPEGGTITVSAAVDESGRKVIGRVSDSGVGIPQKDLPFVFDKFFRVEANNRMAKGTGLGLSLVKHIVESVHKGRLFVESAVGKGSTFGFELDLCE